MRVALTGGIASGKTTVSDRWAELGAVIIDSDVLAREVVEPGTPGLAAVVERFGPEVSAADGTLDRKALAQMVFTDDDARADLEGILHPLIQARGIELEEQAPPGALVVHVIPLLIETGRVGEFDTVVVVDVPTELQVERAMARDTAVADQVRARIAAQATRDQRLAVASHVIDNSGDREQLIAEADAMWRRLQS